KLWVPLAYAGVGSVIGVGQCVIAGCHGNAVTRSRSGLVYRAHWSQEIHDLGATCYRSNRQSSANDLAEGKQIRCPVGVIESPPAGFGSTKASKYFVHDKYCPVLTCDIAQKGVETRFGRDNTNIGRGRFSDNTGYLIRVGFK